MQLTSTYYSLSLTHTLSLAVHMHAESIDGLFFSHSSYSSYFRLKDRSIDPYKTCNSYFITYVLSVLSITSTWVRLIANCMHAFIRASYGLLV
jgi:hypothetical protein